MDEQFSEESGLTGWVDPAARLRQAIEKDEFELYCQPILGLDAGGYPLGEILVRMHEEENALMPPGDFLPVLEHYRMMPQLDRWVVRNALKRLVTGLRVPKLTLNISGQTLADAEFLPFVAKQLAASGVAPQNLLFEIDESEVLARADAVVAFATGSRKLGTGVVIDGFGRRAVSFSVLKGIAADFVKVDGIITRKILGNEVARNKMTAIVRAGAALHFSVIAECVEEESVLDRLETLGVGYAQGFGIYKPHPLVRFVPE